MANYHEYAITEVTNPETVGVGVGDTTSGLQSAGPIGETRICVSLGATPIAWPEGQRPDGYDWVSMTPLAVRALVEQLNMFRHLWERT